MGIIPQSVTVTVDGTPALKIIKAAIAKAKEERLVHDPGAGNVEGELLVALCGAYVEGGFKLSDAQVSAQARAEHVRIVDGAKAKAAEILKAAEEKATAPDPKGDDKTGEKTGGNPDEKAGGNPDEKAGGQGGGNPAVQGGGKK